MENIDRYTGQLWSEFMLACTFFGHRDCPDNILPAMRETLVDLIEHQGIDTFYVGHQGTFDAMVYRTLKELRLSYPHIRYAVVFAYLPTGTNRNPYDSEETLYPEDLEKSPRRFAIDRRNRWMLERSTHVVAYVLHSWGGAAKYRDLAQKRGLRVIDLCDKQ